MKREGEKEKNQDLRNRGVGAESEFPWESGRSTDSTEVGGEIKNQDALILFIQQKV